MTKPTKLDSSDVSKSESNSQIKIAVVEPVGAHGGMDFYNHQLCEALAEAGCKVTLFTSSGFPTDNRHHELILYYQGVFGRDPKWIRAIRFLIAAVRSLSLARRLGIKVTHFHIFHVGLLQYINVLLARAMGMRVLVTAHDVGSFRAGENKALLRSLYRQCSAVIAHSHIAQSTLTGSIGVPTRSVHHVPHGNYKGFLAALPEKEVARKRLGLGSDDFVVLFFGQCKKIKRLDLLIEAVSRARERGATRLRLLIAGAVTDADGAALSEQMRVRLGDSAIHHARYIPNNDLPNYFASADVSVLPYDRILQSGVVLLAMSYRLPVLTSDIDGMLEVVEHGRTGLTFRKGDVDDLTTRLLEIERGDWKLSEFAKAAQEQVFTQNSWTRCGKLTTVVYKEVLDA